MLLSFQTSDSERMIIVVVRRRHLIKGLKRFARVTISTRYNNTD